MAEPHPFWVVILSAAGWLFIVGGIVGEGVYETLVSRADGSLQTFNDILLGRSIDLASSAELLAAEARHDTELLKNENLKLEALIQPRDLTPTQLREVRNRLRPFAGRNLNLRSYALDIEARRLGIILRGAAEQVGLHVTDHLGTMMNLGGIIVQGIEVRGPQHAEDDFINALLASPLGTDRRFHMIRNPVADITGNFGDVVIGENPGARIGVEIFIGIKPIPETR